MLNDKMSAVRDEIESSMSLILPWQYKQFMFDGKIRPEDISIQILFDCSQRAYIHNASSASLRKYRKEGTTEAEAGDARKMKLQRTAEDLNEKNDILANYIEKQLGYPMMKHPAYEKTESGKQYDVNRLDFMELSKAADVSLLDRILNRRLWGEHYTNDIFREDAVEYDRECSTLKEDSEIDEQAVLNSFTFATIEVQYYVDFLYELATTMQKENIREIPDMKSRITAFCYQPTIHSALQDFKSWPFLTELTVHSHAITLRRKFIKEIVLLPEGMDYDVCQMKYLEALFLIYFLQLSIVYEGKMLSDWFITSTDIGDWASVCREYNSFQAFVPNKDWTNKRIRYAKNVWKEMTFDYTSHK